MRKYCCIFFCLIALHHCNPKLESVEKIFEEGVEIVVNHIEPYALKGEPSKLDIDDMFVIDGANDEIINTGLTDIKEFTIDSIVHQIMERGINNMEEKKLHEETLSRLSYGVGTKLITGGEQSALGGVYKLVALNKEPKIKVSENVTKTINPGIKKVCRILEQFSNHQNFHWLLFYHLS